jgi:hypothetical protein
LSVVIDAIKETQARGMGGWRLFEALFKFDPHGHRVQAHVLASETRYEDFAAVFAFEQRAEGRRDLEPPFVIDSRRRVAPEHATLLHFCPDFSIGMLGVGLYIVNDKTSSISTLRPDFRWTYA